MFFVRLNNSNNYLLIREFKKIPGLNLILFNKFSPTRFEPPSKERAHAFQQYLLSKNHTVFIRKNRATDILGACGQLAAQPLSSKSA